MSERINRSPTEDEVEAMIRSKKPYDFYWWEPDGSQGSMAGIVVELTDYNELIVDYGYGIKLTDVESFSEHEGEYEG